MHENIQQQNAENQQNNSKITALRVKSPQNKPTSSYRARWNGKPQKPVQAKYSPVNKSNPESRTIDPFQVLSDSERIGNHQGIAENSGQPIKKNIPTQRQVSDIEKKKKSVQIQQKDTPNIASQGSGLPTQLKENMEAMGGVNLSDVKVNYNSSKPKEMGAMAYAQGSQIEIGPGQEKHLPHEAWHTVQQKQGRVKPNTEVQAKGLPLNDDATLEKEADVMGEKAQQGVLTTRTPRASIVSNSMMTQGVLQGKFRTGKPQRPSIQHDNGFLDAYDEVNKTGDKKFEERDPTWSDRLDLTWWIMKLEGAEALRPDLADGTAAYRHFLFGGGADRTFNYERYVENDASGTTTLNNLIEYSKAEVEPLCPPGSTVLVTSDAYNTGQSGPFGFPYPDTENWQKAIGGHNIWVSGTVSARQVGSEVEYTMHMTIHVEDRYNFNPGQADMATGIPDSANGTFEVTGLANQYMNYSTINRSVTWRGGSAKPANIQDNDSGRNRRPSDNRRLRNRI